MRRSTPLALLAAFIVTAACSARQEQEMATPTEEMETRRLLEELDRLLEPEEPPEGAEAFARQYMELFLSGEMNKLAELFDPDELEEFRDGIMMLVGADSSGGVAEMIGVRDSVEAAALTASEIMARGLLTSVGGREEFEAIASSLRYEIEEIPGIPDKPGLYMAVITLTDTEFPDLETPFPVLIKRTDAGWRAALPPDMRAQFEYLKSMFNGERT